MPNHKVCNRIADPAARRRCLNYEGEFADQGSNPGVAPRANAPMAGRGRLGQPAGGRGRLAGRRPRGNSLGRGRRGGFGGY